jgi:hypothetical protein
MPTKIKLTGFDNLGREVEAEEVNIVRSPYTKLRDMILGQQDFIKKQSDLLKFSRFYTYEGNPNKYNENDKDFESPYWAYCNKTFTKLLPLFLLRLANVYLTDISYYDTEMNDIILEQGTKSDDGDKWVDKYSGYTIKYIDFDLEEGYEESGFKAKNRQSGATRASLDILQ